MYVDVSHPEHYSDGDPPVPGSRNVLWDVWPVLCYFINLLFDLFYPFAFVFMDFRDWCRIKKSVFSNSLIGRHKTMGSDSFDTDEPVNARIKVGTRLENTPPPMYLCLLSMIA